MPKKRKTKKFSSKRSSDSFIVILNVVKNLILQRGNTLIPRKRPFAHAQDDKTGRLSTLLEKSSIKTKILLGTGTIFILIPTFFYINEFVQLSFFTPKIPIVVQKHFSRPIQIQIPAVHLDLPIEETVLTNNSWQIADTGASHLTISARPGENGPIIVYGHNTNDKFGPIRWLSEGQEIQLTTQDGKVHLYKIAKTLQVAPDKTSIFFSEKGETLFLYTCAGFADLQRFIVVAKPV